MLAYYAGVTADQKTDGMAKPSPEISFCVVNTNQRELLLACLESIFTQPPDQTYEVLVVDNASVDGSAESVRKKYGDRVRLIELDRRTAKSVCDTQLLHASEGRYSLLLNEDSQLHKGAAVALYEALERHTEAAAAGTKLFRPDGAAQPSAWRFPGLVSALLGLLVMGRRGVVQSMGESVREVDWAQSAALMIRRDAFEDVGDLDPQFFVYSDEVDWCKRAGDKGWSVLYVPQAHATHHEQLAGDDSYEKRVVEFCRNRDLYVRKHHGTVVTHAVRLLTAMTYLIRATVALVLPGHSPKRYWLHVRQSLFPGMGKGIRESAEASNTGVRSCNHA